VSGFIPNWLSVSVLKSSVCVVKSDNEEAFEEFSEGVIEIYASAGCWVYFVIVVSFVDGL